MALGKLQDKSGRLTVFGSGYAVRFW